MRKACVLVLALSFLTVAAPPAHALWWMVFHKPAFKGRVIDAGTKEPLEGAVVVAVYEKETAGFPEHYSTIIDVRETLTDKDGSFSIPSYTTVISPLSVENQARFIIFKPGYGNFPDYQVSPPNKDLSLIPPGTSGYGEKNLYHEDFFSGEVGIEKEVWASEAYNTKDMPKRLKLVMGVVELPRLETREERDHVLSRADRSHVLLCSQIKTLIRLINEEYKNLGYSHQVKEDCNAKK